MDADIEHLYRQRGIEGVRPRFAWPLIRLAHTGPLTITELATELGKTHSAISQTVAAMRREDLVATEPGADARTRRIILTARGRSLVPFLEAEWRATEAAVAELETEIPYPLTRVVTDLEAALATRPFSERIAALLQAPDDSTARPELP
ncbi:MarR family transcriptional regulator [Occultella glacieicola]|uniref:MarR family transcriptional regulator n=2 Tax=Occultella glacieicola TaxID=2518684 RepID=A0ABY2E7A4_9MICO|nr:MarR family transcriptional regulator [Occultella glacieicola]